MATRHAVPTIYRPDFAAAGGLMGLAAPVAEQWRLVGAYTGRILKGDKPGSLPVQQSTKIDLTINMNAAKALGLTKSQPTGCRRLNSKRNASAWIACSVIEHCRQNDLKQFARL
jgi:ABC-type uncharacterized transport system substrate-binding protein